MLLRSPITPHEHETNLDIVMWGVEHLDIPTTMQGLTVGPPAPEEIERAGRAIGRELEPSEVVGFESGGRRFFVVAFGYKILENTLDIFESSLEYFAGTDPSRSLGELLYRS